MITIENEILKVNISPRGAELTSIINKNTGLEYMWQADPEIWPKHSPVLFPIVGTLKNGQFQYKGKSYELPRHGFSREKMFQVTNAGKDEAVFTLVDDEETRAVYPFQFRFRLKYSLFEDTVSLTYEIFNPSAEDLYFSVGGHPAFRAPLVEDTSYEDYRLEFDSLENQPRWPVTKDGLIGSVPQPLLDNSNTIQLTRELFNQDALVLKSLRSGTVTLKSDRTPHGVKFDFTGFPFLGIWAVKGASFVCIEPWCGIADAENASGDFTNKEGINRLAAQDSFTRTWSASFF